MSLVTVVGLATVKAIVDICEVLEERQDLELRGFNVDRQPHSC